ncbi:MAG: META domain-containing protein [Anaerolineaceae bacterium]|nr:META domain-containing protein [Anaerolineaceae bacterium]
MDRTIIALALLITILISSCSGLNGSSNLEGKWKLSLINGQAPLTGSTISAKFEKGEIGGNSGCNSYGGKYSTSGNKLTLSQLAMTEMACMDPQGVMDQESAFLQAFGQAASYSLNGGNLEVQNASGDTILVFTAE